MDGAAQPVTSGADQGRRGPGGARERTRLVGGIAGALGPALLLAYFTTPLLVGWPSPTAGAGSILAYAASHSTLFYLGGWLQVTGALASIVLFLALLQLAEASATLPGLVVIVGAALLLAVVCVESAFLEAVPMAVADGDPTAGTATFLLANGVFVRIFPLAPAPMLFAGIGLVLGERRVLPRPFAPVALAVAAGFILAGVAAVMTEIGVVLAVVMSLVEAFWIAAAGIAMLVPGRSHQGPVDPTGQGPVTA